MSPKPRPNHARYLQTLRAMTPDQRLAKAFELSAFSKQLFLDGLRRRFPDLGRPSCTAWRSNDSRNVTTGITEAGRHTLGCGG